ncbi:MAG: PA14 domain-containing protein [Enhygromyxa sp.]
MRTYLSLATVLMLATAGCANKKNEETQNPDGSGGTGTVDGTDGADDGDAKTPSRARASTAPRGADRNTKARKVTAKKPPRAPVDNVPDEQAGPNGLFAEAFALESAEALPDFESLSTASSTFEVPNLDYDEVEADQGFPGLAGLTQNYAIKFSGSINIIDEAEYELCLHSDDGSQLLLEDYLLVDNDGVHDGPVESCELVYLAPGEYQLEVRYFQGAGPLLAMHFAWAINGGDKVIVPSEVLFKPETSR